MIYTDSAIAPYAKVAVKLLQGAVFDDQKEIWEEMIRYEAELYAYFKKIALELLIDKSDGFAYLKQMELDDQQTTIGLVRRMPLTYEQTLVCILLREWLEDHEVTDLETRNLYITPKEFRERLEIFFGDQPSENRLIKELNSYLADMEKMGFLKLVHKDSTNTEEQRFEVRRIIKAKVTNEDLIRFKQQLKEDAEFV